jgi:hypothetical protein
MIFLAIGIILLWFAAMAGIAEYLDYRDSRKRIRRTLRQINWYSLH